MITTDEIPESRMLELERAGVECAECGARMTVAWGGAFGVNSYILRCGRKSQHQGLVTEARLTPYDVPGFNLYESKTRRNQVEQSLVRAGTPPAVAREMAAQHNALLTQERAVQIINACFPGAPQAEVTKAAMICHQYGLNPLMKHVHLVPFKTKDGGKTWATVLGIKATRLMAAQMAGKWGYLDDTPRIMTEAEEKRIYGTVDKSKLRVVVKIRDAAGLQYSGYGWWPRDKGVYGDDKGNSQFNMASIRAERQALERMSPGGFEGTITMDEAEIEGRMVQPGAEFEALPEEAELDWEIPVPARTIDSDTGEIIEDKPQPKPVTGLDRGWILQAVSILGWSQQKFYGWLQDNFTLQEWPECTPGIWWNICLSLSTKQQDELKTKLNSLVNQKDGVA